MPNIRPIRDLRNTLEISELCHSTDEPVFITKNGYSDMVIMSSEVYDELVTAMDIYKRIFKSLDDIANGNVFDGEEVLKEMRKKYNYEV